MSDGFLARWSRRKRDEARRPAEPPAAAPETAAPTEVPAEDDASLSPEELARLPSLDALTAATDLTPFLRAGVPRALRNAALRRMWSLDPAIRDFVSEAREYAYDWNTPGGVPGTGGAISAEDVRAMVEKVFGGVEDNAPDNPEKDGASASRPPLQATPGLPGIAARCGRGAGGEGATVLIEAPTTVLVAERPELEPPTAPPSPLPLSHSGEGIPRHPSDQPDTSPEPPSPPRLRRHGGALPI